MNPIASNCLILSMVMLEVFASRNSLYLQASVHSTERKVEPADLVSDGRTDGWMETQYSNTEHSFRRRKHYTYCRRWHLTQVAS